MTNCKMEPLEVEIWKECLSKSADCQTEVEVCTTELLEKEVCEDLEALDG